MIKKIKQKNLDAFYNSVLGADMNVSPKEKQRASGQAKNALKNGSIKKKSTCTHCGSRKKLVMHHNDYKKPLEVTWYCHSCHREWHAFHKQLHEKDAQELIWYG